MCASKYPATARETIVSTSVTPGAKTIIPSYLVTSTGSFQQSTPVEKWKLQEANFFRIACWKNMNRSRTALVTSKK
jgi:hypothetical protein